ncbi:hypothetical protein MRX96_005073 [Rhipicephalus microplus]
MQGSGGLDALNNVLDDTDVHRIPIRIKPSRRCVQEPEAEVAKPERRVEPTPPSRNGESRPLPLFGVVFILAWVQRYDRGDASVSMTSSSNGQLMDIGDSRTIAKAKTKTQRKWYALHESHVSFACLSSTNGGCPFATKRAAWKESPREDVLKAELALCFEEA